ncbi:probable G-protein coupled receptor 179 [Perognathus longimembris pacificus]|uniref:probable G-protein coupled receptor 179 n=1 Tax=Perognathus longimembris pacificus TaxID=214514 RepID=UPI002019A714|nr:probable G-protein coupled receptor 179 [Perognathus longimembris pacificus]
MGTRTVVMPSPVWGLLGFYFLCGWALGGPRVPHSLPPLSSQAKPRLVPMWEPPQGAEAALAFLYSGDAQQLLGANCSERFEAQGAEAKPRLPPVLQRAADTLAQAANFLNMLLQANDIRESSVEEDVEWYQALVRSVAEGDPRTYRALLTFNPPPGASHLQLALQATRMGEETILQDLSGNRVQEANPAVDMESSNLQKRVLTNDLRSLNSPKWPQGDGYVGDIQQVRLSPPFLECQEGRLRPGWLVTLAATFYGLKPDLSPEVRGQVQMDIDLQSVDINQCASIPGWYSNTHLCDLNSTQCVPLESQGFVLGRYLCHCRPGFYGASGSGGLESVTQTTRQLGSPHGNSGKLLRCQPCPEGCTSCMDATPCLVEEAWTLRAAVLACQACCMLAVFLSMLVSYRCRGSKSIRASGVVLLETILFGSLLLYFPVFILYFKPSVFRCIALRWVRLLGFVIVYGTVILKLYRVLQLFLSRTAQRGPHLSSGRLLWRLGLLLLLVLGFLCVWTSGVLERGTQHTPLVTRGHTPTGRHFYLCHHDRWDYIMVVAEMLLLCWGSFLCYATRAVPSAFHEPRYMGIALHNELLLSAAFHTARFVLVPSLHPDWMLLLFFFHTHSTVTVTLALIFIPKFQKPGAPPREEILDEVYEDELDLQRSGSYLNSSIASAWSERSLDPGDIRDELKKLYAQLEVRKTKEMAANNPHLPKKRGSSRQGLGRSFMRYLAEFPEALARQHSRDSGSPGLSSLPGSSRRRLLSSSLHEAEGAPAPHKSHSTYDQGEQDPPLLNSLLRRNLSKKASPMESQESVDGPPALGFRSASAHNLTVGERLPRTRPMSLQKSLSVVTGSREKALLVASQAYLEETYRQAKEREERKKAELAIATPVRRPSARRLERARGPPLSAPPSPAKSSSMDSSYVSGRLHEEAGRKLPHPPIRHQVSTPILALSGACLGEPRMLSPTSTLAPALMPALAPAPTPGPVLAPVPVVPQSPSLLTYICPWENAELPVKKENVVQEAPSGSERGGHASVPARARLWRTLSVAVEKKGAGENEIDTEDGRLQGEADVDEDRPKISKSHSLKTPVQQGSMRSLGLAIKALTRSRSTYREKEGGDDSPEKDRATGSGMGVSLRSPRLGRPKAVSKQAALSPCDDEESLQNQQNAHTSRMLQVCHQAGSREQEDRARTSQGLGEQKVERASKTGLATLKQILWDKNAEQAKEAIVGCRELPNVGLQSQGSADSKVTEVCPWEVSESETCQPDSSNKTKICPWEENEGAPERKVWRQDLGDSQDKKGKALEKSEPRGVVVIARKKPERLVRGQEAVCPWEGADPGGASCPSAPQDSDRMQGSSGEADSVETRAEKHQGEAPGPGVCSPNIAKAELCPWEVSDGQVGTVAQGVKEFPQERQKAPKKATLWSEQKLVGNLESICPWESTDFRGPTAVSLPASGSPGHSGSWGSGIVEVCPWEAGNVPANRKAEVCPWDTGDERREEGVGGESLLHKEKEASRKGILGDVEEKVVEAVPTGNQWQESATSVQSSSSPDNSSSKAGSQVLGNEGSRAVQVCPWDVLKPEEKEATPATAEICPWELDDGTENWTLTQTPKGGISQKDKEKMPGKTGIEDVTTWKKSEEQSQKQETVCPWENVASHSFPVEDTERPGSMGSKAAEICPWDVEEALTAEKVKICPWEVDAGAAEKMLGDEAVRKSPNDTQDTSTDSGPRQTAVPTPEKQEKPILEQEVACPRENLSPSGFSQHPDTPNMDRPKPELQELAHAGCKPAEVCPWEVEEAPTREKVKICPWEINEGATMKELEQTMNELAGEREKTLEKKGLMCQEGGISKQEANLQVQEAICPWEDTDLKEPSAQTPKGSVLPSSTKSQLVEGHSSEVSDGAMEKRDLRQDPKTGPALPAEAVTQDEKKTSNKELPSVCPWESTVTAGSSSQPASQYPDQPTVSSQSLVTTGSRVAEVCPWNVPVLDACKPDSSTKAEICPWVVTEQIPEKRALKQDRKEEAQEKERALEKPELKGVAVQKMTEMANLRKQEAVCSRESQDQGSLSPQPTSSRSKGSSETAGCVCASMAEVCPWEAEEDPSTKKADICPWEVNTGGAGDGGMAQGQDRESQGQGEAGSRGAEHFPKAAANLSSESVTVCTWKSTGSGVQQEALDTDNDTKVSPDGASSMRRIAELCQWEVTDPEGNKIKGTMADICPWEVTRAPSEEPAFLALTATVTENVCPSPEQSLCLLVHRPLASFLPDFKSSHLEVSKLGSTITAEGVTELQGPSGLGPRINLAPNSSLQEAEGQKSSHLTEVQGQEASQAQDEEFGPPSTYPWDWEQ